MKKTILLSGIATALLATSANATEATTFNHYVSAKAAFVHMINDAHAISDYAFSGNQHTLNTFSKEKHEDNVFGLRLAAGTVKPLDSNQLRAEFELGWNSNARDSNGYTFRIKTPYNQKFATKLSVYSAMLNLYYDFNTGTKFTPYVGAGLGYAYLKNKTKVTGPAGSGAYINQGSSEGDHNIAYNISAGVSYALNDKVSFDAGYRYSDYGKVKETTVQSATGLKALTVNTGHYDVTAHEFLLGLRYAF